MYIEREWIIAFRLFFFMGEVLVCNVSIVTGDIKLSNFTINFSCCIIFINSIGLWINIVPRFARCLKNTSFIRLSREVKLFSAKILTKFAFYQKVLTMYIYTTIKKFLRKVQARIISFDT